MYSLVAPEPCLGAYHLFRLALSSQPGIPDRLLFLVINKMVGCSALHRLRPAAQYKAIIIKTVHDGEGCSL